jgi:uncharacterized protein involved in type VI secretion and phage assembly
LRASNPARTMNRSEGAGMSRLRIGEVVGLNDPETRGRVRVRFAENFDTDVWARVATLCATATLVPEIGDQVVVGVLDGPDGEPVVLGSLPSRNRPMPEPVTERNDVKVIRSRGAVEIRIDDDAKSLTLRTPGGNSVTLDDATKSVTLADQHDNRIEMGPDGIRIASPKRIILESNGDLLLTSKLKTTVTAVTDTTISGLNVSIAAQAAASVKGAASAELSASGQTTVRGGIVMIN